MSLIRLDIEDCWGPDTCYPKQRKEWTPENPALGQCAVTTLLLHEIYGGTILFNKEWNHFWLKLPNNQDLDITRDQFTDAPLYMEGTKVSRSRLLKGHTKERYELLREKYMKKFA